MIRSGLYLTGELEKRLIFPRKLDLHKNSFLEQYVIDSYVGG